MYDIQLGVPSGKRQRREFVYLLWNVPIHMYSDLRDIFFIILEVLNRFRYIEKGGTQLQNYNFGTF